MAKKEMKAKPGKDKKAKRSNSTESSLVYEGSPRSVNIEKAENGFTVSCYDDKGRRNLIAKSEAEAVRHAKALLTKGHK